MKVLLAPQSDQDSGRAFGRKPAMEKGINMCAARLAAALLLVQVMVSACSDEPSPPDIDFLVLDGEFEIAGHWISVPIVALDGAERFTVGDKSRQYGRNDLEEQAINGGIPMHVDNLELAIRLYGSTGEFGVFMQICPRLTRTWARLVCRGEQKGMLKRLPASFSLVDRAKLVMLKSRGATGGGTQYDQVKGMQLRPGVTEVACNKDAKLCTAVVEPLPGLIAVWIVGRNERETVAQRAQDQGPAIVEFVRRAIGRTEDRTLATAD